MYLLQHTVQLLHDFVVPKPQYRIALIAQPGIPALVIIHLFGMLSTIDFNNQPKLQAHKVNDIAA